MKKTIAVFSVVCAILLCFVLVFYLAMYPRRYKKYVNSYSSQYELERALVYAVIKTESGFNAKAESNHGAMGLMQVMPTTAQWIAEKLGEDYNKIDIFEPETNIRFGCYYLRYLFDKFNDFDTAVCAYNAGEGKVLDWLDENGKLDQSLIDYKETANYLVKVKKHYKVYRLQEMSV